MALMSLMLDKTILTVADLLANPLAKYITLAANDCGYSGKAKKMIRLTQQLAKLTILVGVRPQEVSLPMNIGMR